LKSKHPKSRLVVCIKNRSFAASLELRKIYRAVPDVKAERHRLIRVIDESGEDYLFPDSCFVGIELPRSIARIIAAAS
jgi:hypothetical protein